jgi:peptidoglycan/LPS O-acetylase OafA/YrhL
MPTAKLSERIPSRKIIGFTGFALILAGFFFLNIDPDTEPTLAIKNAFTGMGLIIVGAATSLGALMFAE